MTSRRAHAIAALVVGVWGLGLASCGRDSSGGAEVVLVPGDQPTISAALAEVREGGLVLVSPGRYEESVIVDVPDVTVRGTDRNEVIIDGGDERTDGVRVVAEGVRLQNFTVENATANGIIINGADNVSTRDEYAGSDMEGVPLLSRFEVSHVTASNNGLYGIYAFHSSNGVIRDTYTSGSSDAGLYVGQCDACNVVVESNVAERNAVGFENANASGVTVIGNRFVGNRVGLTLTSNYQEAFVPQRANVVVGNLIAANNEAATPQQAQGGFGIGVGLSGAQDNQIIRNRIDDHAAAAVVISNAEDVPSTGNQLVANILAGNAFGVADTSNVRASSAGNCRIDEVAGQLEDDLGERLCRNSRQALADGPAPARVEAPAGVPYFEVEPGPAQSNMTGNLEEVPGSLPPSPAAVDLVTIPTASRTLLASRAAISL